jgi:hypothetical protein
MSHTLKLLAALLLAAPLSLLAAPHDAAACGNALVDVYDEMDSKGNLNYPVALKRAERYLQRNKNAEALSTVSQAYWELTRLDDAYQTPEKIKRSGNRHHKPALVQRAARIAALAIIRTGGRISFDEYPGRVKAGSDKRLTWAVGVINHLHAKTPDDVELRNYQAEALAAQPGKRADALTAFAALEQEKLLLDSSKAPLARLRSDKPAPADDAPDDPRPRSTAKAKSKPAPDRGRNATGDAGLN